MYLHYRLFSCSVLFLSLVSGFCFGYDKNDVDTVEKKVLETRLQIKSWHIVFSSNQERGTLRPPVPGAVETGPPVRRELWYDGARFREDNTYVKEGHTAQDKDSTFKRMTVMGDEYWYLYNAGLDTDEERWALISMSKEMAFKSIAKDFPLVDIRLLGMVPWATFLGDCIITEVIGNAERTELKMIDDNLDGIACKKISFLDRRSIPTSVWIAPEQGFSIIRVEKSSEKHNFHTTMIVRVVKHEPSGIWFPTECLCMEIDNDGKMQHRLDIKIETASFNSPIPDDIFTPKTMDVPVGTTATKTEKVGAPSGSWVWDGNKIASEHEVALADIPPRGNGLRYLLAAIGLALICAGCVGKYLELSKNKRKPSGG